MPIAKGIDESIADITDPVSRSDLHQLAQDNEVARVQASDPLSENTWRLIDDTILAARPDIHLRVYGFYDSNCDLSFVSKLSHVRHFSADCLQSATCVEAIADLDQLKSLSIGIFDLKSFCFLEELPANLDKLSLHATKSKKPDLSVLERFGDLRELYIEGQQKNIEVISTLKKLEDITLRSVSTADISYVAALSKLWSLDLKLGGIKNFDAISELRSLKYLEMWRIRGLTDVEFISQLATLQNLKLETLSKVQRLPPLDQCVNLRRIVLLGLRGLIDLTALEHAPALEEFALHDGIGLDPRLLVPALRNPNVKGVSYGFGTDELNEEFASLLKQSGKVEANFAYEEFNYV